MVQLTKDDVVDFTIRATFNFFSEFLGTGILVFLGCMSTVEGLGLTPSVTGICLTFAFAVVIGIEVGVPTSGGLINPMLTIAAVIFKRVTPLMAVFYVLGQFCGALVGYGLLLALIPRENTNTWQKNGACVHAINERLSVVQAVFVEFITSSIFVLLVCSQWDPRNTRFEAISIKIGFGIFSLAYASITLTGCGMNPARSFAPALWNNSWNYHWIFWVCPITASVLWSFIYYKIFVELAPKPKEE